MTQRDERYRLTSSSAARGAKADLLKASYAGYGDRFEVVKIADIVHDQFPDAFVGVSAVMHLASPLPGRVPPAEILKVCVASYSCAFCLMMIFRRLLLMEPST